MCLREGTLTLHVRRKHQFDRWSWTIRLERIFPEWVNHNYHRVNEPHVHDKKPPAHTDSVLFDCIDDRYTYRAIELRQNKTKLGLSFSGLFWVERTQSAEDSP